MLFPLEKLATGEMSEEEAIDVIYDAPANVRRLSNGFRSLGYMIIYVGLAEDTERLESQQRRFDSVLLIDKDAINDPSIIPKNKRLMYKSLYAGFDLAYRAKGDSLVIRWRSDAYIELILLDDDIQRLSGLGCGDYVLTEYIDGHDLLNFPDAMFAASSKAGCKIFGSLYNKTLKRMDNHTHVHYDIILEIMSSGAVPGLVAIREKTRKSMLWRGGPMYNSELIQLRAQQVSAAD